MQNRVNSPLYLDQRFRSNFVRMSEDPVMLKHHFKIFESYRSDDEQLRVFNLGTSKARPGESAHNWGLAVDFVVYHEGLGWDWPKRDCDCWLDLAKIAPKYELDATFGATLLDWDLPHVEVPNWRAIRSQKARDEAQRLYLRRHG